MKKISKFKDEDQGREFWEKSDSTEYVDWDKAKKVEFPNLRPSEKNISPPPVKNRKRNH